MKKILILVVTPNTVNVKLKSKSEFNVDTGFIVFNEINYPNLCKLFDELDVKTYSSDMSFSASINNGKLEYSGSNFASLFAQKKNIINSNFLKMLFEIVKFYSNVENDSYKFQEISIEEYLQIKKYSHVFKHNHIYPMASSIWSSSLEEIKKCPFKQFVNFFFKSRTSKTDKQTKMENSFEWKSRICKKNHK